MIFFSVTRRAIAIAPLIILVPGSATAGDGLWTSAAELRSVPMKGPAWHTVLHFAREPVDSPNVADQEDPTNANVLAAAIVYARTAEPSYRDAVVRSIEKLVAKGHPGGRTLAWARETGAYALAADLVDYRSSEFDAWLDKMTDGFRGSQLDCTMREMFEMRPNNWGTHAFGSLVAVYAYRHKTRQLQEVRRYFIRSVSEGNRGLSLRYSRPFGWHADLRDKRLINPAGATKEGFVVDGLIPDDMRRGGDFTVPPTYTNYVWEGQQGLIMAARVLDRVGMPIWDVADRAIYRAASALHVRLASEFGNHWKAKGDDQWMIRFINHAYDSDLDIAPAEGWDHGKNAGFAFVILGNDADQEADPQNAVSRE